MLDMCAAPGSKTSQLIEAMHRAAPLNPSTGRRAAPTGMVVANEVHTTRAHMLVGLRVIFSAQHLVATPSHHRVNNVSIVLFVCVARRLIHHLRHLHSPCLVVTSHSAQLFPNSFRCLNTTDDSSVPMGAGYGDVDRTVFDSILCDVPCTGDGTVRKAASLWETWHPHKCFGYNRLQVQILWR